LIGLIGLLFLFHLFFRTHKPHSDSQRYQRNMSLMENHYTSPNVIHHYHSFCGPNASHQDKTS